MQNYYRISFKNSAGLYHQYFNNTYTPGTVPYYLNFAPDGWQDVEIGMRRNIYYLGFQRASSEMFTFVEDAAHILRNIWYSRGLRGDCLVWIEKLNHSTQVYDYFFSTWLDFSNVTDEDTNVQLKALEQGLVAIFKANETIDFEVPLAASDAITVQVNPFKVQGKVSMMSGWPVPQNGQDEDPFPTAHMNKIYQLFIDKTIVPTKPGLDGDPVYVANPVQTTGIVGEAWEQFNGITNDRAENFIMGTRVQLYDVKVQQDIGFYLKNTQPGVSTIFKLRLTVRNGATWTDVWEGQVGAVASGADVSTVFNINATFDMPANSSLIMYITSFPTGPASNNLFDVKWQNQKPLLITFSHYTEMFTFPARRYVNVYKDLVSKVTNNAAVGVSSLLSNPVANQAAYQAGVDNIPYHTAITSSTAIAGQNNPVVKTSIKKLFKDADVKWCVGLGFETNAIRMEKKEYFFNPNVVMADIGEVSSVKVVDAEEFQYSSMKIGYENQEYDGVNGLDEPNVTHTYTFPIGYKLQELELVSPYRHDMYGIFFAWVNNILLNNSGSANGATATASNNETFVIEISPTPNLSGFYEAKTWPTAPITGISDTVNAFNLGVTPAHNLKRHGRFLRSCLWNCDGENIEFKSSDKPATLGTAISNPFVSIYENQHWPVSQLGNRMFYPKYFIVSVPSDENWLTMVNSGVNGVIKFMHPKLKSQFDGFPMAIFVKPGNPQTYELALLFSPNVDMNKLKNS